MVQGNELACQQQHVIDTFINHGSLTEQDALLIAQSDFLFENLRAYPDWLDLLYRSPPKNTEWQDYPFVLQQQMNGVNSDEQLMQVLRLFRRYYLVRIAWMQLMQTATVTETLTQLTTLADVIIITAKTWLYQDCCRLYGTPVNKHGVVQPFLVIGMGKLGGNELNFSSDIDLIFTYPENGETQGHRRKFDNSQFFIRLGQRFIKILDQKTADGFVYRVDMRLRPFGDNGSLVYSFTALEDYYQEQGRDWERYAMIKARIIGESPYDNELYAMLKPFVYRRYIDFSVIQSLRNMKRMIEREIRRRGLLNNFKLGVGGIREIEFIVQVFQLIRGGREPILQNRSLLFTLDIIEQRELLSRQDVNTLKENYLFLRRLENVLQAIHDEQTQTLPKNQLDQQRLCYAMGFEHWSLLSAVLDNVLQTTHRIFNHFIGDEQEDTAADTDTKYSDLWFSDTDEDKVVSLLPNILNEQEKEQLVTMINQFKKEIKKRTIGVRGQEVLDILMPKIFTEVCHQNDVLIVFPRIIHILLKVITRTTYLELLLKYPAVLNQLITLCAASPMITEQFANHPILLDELLDQESLYHVLSADEYYHELSHYLLRVPDDEEQQIEALCQFKQMQVLHIAAADVVGYLPTMKVSDHLTYLAEAIINTAVELAWNQMIKRYGKPQFLVDTNDRGLLIIGYGKLGGWELGYGSDLDLVFVSSCPENDVTDGEKQIDSRLFYQRFVQRIIHLFSIKTASGSLYEIDMRLRPAGDAGLLICSIHAFTYYHTHDAWIWENQALVRARAVYGQLDLVTQFIQLRHQILCQKREDKMLRESVKAMREKMRYYLSKKETKFFDLKIDEGGIGDIEFLSQYFVLRYAEKEPGLTKWSDNVRILELVVQYGLVEKSESIDLTQAYLIMRDKIHQLFLQQQPPIVLASEFQHERDNVKRSWKKWLD